MKFFNRIICCIVLAILSCFMEAQGQSANSASVRDFVQQFYRWYVPEALKEHKGPAWDLKILPSATRLEELAKQVPVTE